jgi:hypothetical protein
MPLTHSPGGEGLSDQATPFPIGLSGARDCLEFALMNESTILLISRDSSLIEEVRDLADDVDDLVVANVGGLDETYAFADWDRVALVLIHHDRRSTTNGVLRLPG